MAKRLGIPKMRRVAVLETNGHGCVIKQHIPALKRGQVLIRVSTSVISPGTELSSAIAARRGEQARLGRARPFGYQNAGRIVALGSGVKSLKIGDRVACMGGGYALHTDWAVVPQNLVVELPANVAYEQGAYVHLAATALAAIRRGRPELGEYLLVVGLGIVGQFAAQLGRLSGATVMGWDRLPRRLAIARRCGIDAAVNVAKKDARTAAETFTEGGGFDMAIIAVGGEGTDLVQLVAGVMKQAPDGHRMGRIVIVGGLSARMIWPLAFGNIDVHASSRTGPGYHDDDWEHGRYTYPPAFVRWTTHNNLELVLRLMSQRHLKVDPLTTHRLPFSLIDQAIANYADPKVRTLGTVLTMA